VTCEIPEQSPAEVALNQLQKSLLYAYKKASKWTITQTQNAEKEWIVPEASDNEKWTENFKILDVHLGVDYTDKYMVDMTVVKGIYTYCFTYNDNKYKCEGRWPDDIRLPSNEAFKIKNRDSVTVPFGNAVLTFECKFEKRVGLQRFWSWLTSFFQNRSDPKAGTLTSPDGLFQNGEVSDEDDDDEET
jgi:hypothetical protein